MIIDNTTYVLSDTNFFKDQTIKKRIILTHSSSIGDSHIVKWKTRLNGRYKKTAAFTVSLSGKIYQHYDPIYFSEFSGNLEMDKGNIIVILENEGWLIKNEEKKQFINWSGNIYNRLDDVVERKWRGYRFWAPYTSKQFTSTISLISTLCEDFYIPKIAMPNNVKSEGLEDFKGVLYRSNFEKHYTDISPAWNCEEFKYKLEKNEKEYD